MGVHFTLLLFLLETTSVTAMSRESILKNYLCLVKDRYDYVRINCSCYNFYDKCLTFISWFLQLKL